MILKNIIETKEYKEKRGIFNEAFSLKNLEKISSLLASLYSKIGFGKFKPATKSWYKNDFKSEDGEKGVGYLYISNEGYMIRFSFVNRKTKAKGLKDKYSVDRVDFWKPDGSAKFNKPSLTVILPPWVNIVDVANIIADGLKTGYIVESKTVNEDSPVPRMNAYAKSKGLDISNMKGYGTIKKKLISMGAWDEEEYKAFKIKDGVKENNTTIEVMNQAEEKFEETPYADPNVVFEDIEKLTKVIALGFQNGLIVAGAAGLGKTFHTQKTLEELFGSPKGPDAKWKQFKGLKASPFGLYKILFQYRDNMTIVFDDSDGFLLNRDCVNMLKSAMDTTNPREISWFSTMTTNIDALSPEERDEYLLNLEQALSDPDKVSKVGTKIKLPASFNFTSRIIFVSNLPGDKFIKDPDLAAIRSRSMFIDVKLSREGVIERIKSLLPYIMPEVPVKEKEDLLEALAEKDGGNLTMRAIVAAIGVKQAGVADNNEELLRLVKMYMS